MGPRQFGAYGQKNGLSSIDQLIGEIKRWRLRVLLAQLNYVGAKAMLDWRLRAYS